MNDPTLKAAVEAVEKQLFEQWCEAKFEADQKYIHATMRGMHEFLRSLQATVDSGKVAASSPKGDHMKGRFDVCNVRHPR